MIINTSQNRKAPGHSLIIQLLTLKYNGYCSSNTYYIQVEYGRSLTYLWRVKVEYDLYLSDLNKTWKAPPIFQKFIIVKKYSFGILYQVWLLRLNVMKLRLIVRQNVTQIRSCNGHFSKAISNNFFTLGVIKLVFHRLADIYFKSNDVMQHIGEQ